LLFCIFATHAGPDQRYSSRIAENLLFKIISKFYKTVNSLYQ